jgi:hypothetical protein
MSRTLDVFYMYLNLDISTCSEETAQHVDDTSSQQDNAIIPMP